MNKSDTSKSNPSTRSILLAIEISNPNVVEGAHAAAIFSMDSDESVLLGSMPIPEGIKSSDSIMILVETLCATHQVAPSEITSIAVSVGPGGYTSLRIACTTAKVLAQTIGTELYAIPTSQVAAQAIEQSHRPALIALASKNERAYCAILQADGTIQDIGMSDASVFDRAGTDQSVFKSFVADKHAPSLFTKRATELGLSIIPIVLDARNCLQALDGIERCKPTDLVPLYAREPDAVTQWRARSSSK
ncbi:MAG: tRNA (adenosine(37)-N6)-threonylcarbamoyltransferase complex dimerization subunit type 1 TsaB [Phycisphaerales bacterium]|nr:tRNA (adenosine(37)-N6)-threonylcarbamoyltransferase complex dimerization subunit type 1 TsaB [Phycisphaerales bacterium]